MWNALGLKIISGGGGRYTVLFWNAFNGQLWGQPDNKDMAVGPKSHFKVVEFKHLHGN